MVRRKAQREVVFDDHMALSYDEVVGILKFFDIKRTPFFEWMIGQTCPMINGRCGYYWFDVHRYIRSRLTGDPLFWD